jgi:hypothetical protein
MFNFQESDASIFHTVPMPNVPTPDECVDFYECVEGCLLKIESGKLDVPELITYNFKRRLYDKPYTVIDVNPFVVRKSNYTSFQVRPVNPREHFLLDKITNRFPLKYW